MPFGCPLCQGTSPLSILPLFPALCCSLPARIIGVFTVLVFVVRLILSTHNTLYSDFLAGQLAFTGLCRTVRPGQNKTTRSVTDSDIWVNSLGMVLEVGNKWATPTHMIFAEKNRCGQEKIFFTVMIKSLHFLIHSANLYPSATIPTPVLQNRNKNFGKNEI